MRMLDWVSNALERETMRPAMVRTALAGAFLAAGITPPAAAKVTGIREGVRYLAGGVGIEARKAMRAEARDYTAMLSFSGGKDEHYLANVDLTVRDQRGAIVFEIARAGPLVYLDLEAGRYRVEARHGKLLRTATLTLDGVGQSAAYLHFPAA